MALIVETGAGLSNADSYSSVADITTYLTAYKSAADLAVWTAYTEQETAARAGTQYLDARFSGRWAGFRAHESQSLAWPRSAVTDGDGYVVLSTSLPTALKNATAEAAFRVANGSTLISDESAGSNIKSESSGLGELSEAVSYVGMKASSASFPIIDQMLADFVEGTGSGFGSVRFERA